MKEQVGVNPALEPVSALFYWLLNSGSSIISDELMGKYLDQHRGGARTSYIERTNAAPALITRAAEALHKEGLSVEWENLLDDIRYYQQSQKNLTDSAKILHSLLQVPPGEAAGITALLLPASSPILFAASSLIESIDEPIELIRELSFTNLQKVNRLVVNGYIKKTVGALITFEKPFLTIDWLLSTQEAARLQRSMLAILEIQDFALFHPQVQRLSDAVSTKLGQIKTTSLSTIQRTLSTRLSGSEHNQFSPIAEIVFIDGRSLLVGEGSELLRYDSSDATAIFSNVQPAELQVDDEILWIDEEVKSLFIEAIPEEYRATILPPEETVLQYRKYARNFLSSENIQDIESAITYCQKNLAENYPESYTNITSPMLRYWCEGIFSDDIKSSPKASISEKYFLDFSEVIGFNREIAQLSYQEGFCKTRGNHISQGRKENVALGQILIDRSMGRNYHIPEYKLDVIVEHAIDCVNMIRSINPIVDERKANEP